MSALTARKVLERSRYDGDAWQGEHPETLPLAEIKRQEELFQRRSPKEFRSRHHVRSLARVPGKMGRHLDPLTVWWAGWNTGWICLDGHHRLDAYAEAEWKKPVPVEVFEGTLDDAILEALRRNTRDHLAMDGNEKMDGTWHTVVLVGYTQSKRAIADASGLSDRTIANMREVAKQFGEKRPMQDPSAFTWRQAQDLVRDDEAPRGDDAEAAREERLEKLADALISRFGPVMRKDPDLFAEAIRRADPALPEALREAFERWSEDLDGVQHCAQGDGLPFPLPVPEEEIF